ncbi:GAMM1 protein [Salix suchowensis]|nr:GAMM1 protein [Salix suchowensis]
MRSSLLPLFLLPLFASAQQQSGGNSNNVQLSTTIIVSPTIGPDRAESSVTITLGGPPARQCYLSNHHYDPANLPTAQSVDAGQTHSAPIPGAKAGGGIYGPDDDYTAGALALKRSTVLMGAAGLVAGGLGSRVPIHRYQFHYCVQPLFRTMSSESEQASKKQKLTKASFTFPHPVSPTDLVIGTHNGTFHCDEALAVFLLRLTNTYRESAILQTCDIVVDVGAVYDESKQLFDHHQRGFTEVFGLGFATKLSSAGLVYKYDLSLHFGKEVISNVTQLPMDDEKVETLWLKMYKVCGLEFIEAIDAIDNGIAQYPADVKPLYRSRTDLSSRVGYLNPTWNEPVDAQVADVSLMILSTLPEISEFLGRLKYYANAWLPARNLLIASMANSLNVDPSGKIIEHLFELEAQQQTPEDAKAIYVAVPVSPESFQSRKALPEAWRGLRDDELSSVSKIEGGIFVHASGFIGGEPLFLNDSV